MFNVRIVIRAITHKKPLVAKSAQTRWGVFLFVKKSQNFDIIIHVIMTLYYVV